MVELNLNFDKLVTELEISSKSPDFTSSLTGNFLSSFKGDGFEFEGFRKYAPGDDSKKIDWLASSKTDELLVREFTAEKNLEFFILMDSSYGMFFTSSDKLKCECAAEIVANLSFSMVEANNKVGIGLFNNQIHSFLNADTGKVHFQKIISKLKDNDLYGGEKDYKKVFSELVGYIKDKVIVIIISDFLNFNDEDKNYLKLLSTNFQVIGIMLRDKIEKRIPKNAGVICLEDINSLEQVIVNTQEIADEYNITMKSNEMEIQNFFLENDFEFFKIYTHEDIVTKLIEFFNSRGG
jgi:uncharacterized protein (DUF58 family)